jgi:hypothetical protein
MLFKEGTYKHETCFTVMIDKGGQVMLSPNHPMSIKLKDMFDSTQWTKVE